MKLVEPFGVDIDLVEGIMAAPDRHLVRNTQDMRGYYADEAAFERLVESKKAPLHYEVFEKENVPEELGHVMFSISKLQPGLIGEECFMTKGHYHSVLNTAEIYWCLRGRGHMMMKVPGGRCVIEPMRRNRLVYVPPYWAHRSINTGDEPLISLCVYPAAAGHNYGDIVTEGFPQRVFLRNGQEVIE